jgi:hypothetical protein
LTHEKQHEILSALGDNGNYDVIPIAVIENEQSRGLTAEDFYFADEILEDDDKLNFYMELLCSAGSVFYSLAELAPDDYFNVYTNYNISTQQVEDALDIIIYRSDGDSETTMYKLTESEKETILEKMNSYCQQREGMTLDEYCETLQNEMQTQYSTPEL